MTLTIDIIDETNQLNEKQQNLIEDLLQFASKKEKIETPCEVSVTIVDNEQIHRINKEYRGVDRPTDVISFALEEMGEEEIPVLGSEAPTVLGDIIISIDKIKEQAEEYGHSEDRELGFLAVHGFLHLLGYDHENEADEKIMFEQQRDILNEFGLKR